MTNKTTHNVEFTNNEAYFIKNIFGMMSPNASMGFIRTNHDENYNNHTILLNLANNKNSYDGTSIVHTIFNKLEKLEIDNPKLLEKVKKYNVLYKIIHIDVTTEYKVSTYKYATQQEWECISLSEWTEFVQLILDSEVEV